MLGWPPFFAWKILTDAGMAPVLRHFLYKSGWNSPARDYGTGLHVYRNKPMKRDVLPGEVLLQVRISPSDVVGAECAIGIRRHSGGRFPSELEVLSLFIYKADWRKAGLP